MKACLVLAIRHGTLGISTVLAIGIEVVGIRVALRHKLLIRSRLSIVSWLGPLLIRVKLRILARIRKVLLPGIGAVAVLLAR